MRGRRRTPWSPLKGKPKNLLFEKPVQRVVREEDLPVILSWEVGKSIEVLRFYEGGVTLSEVNTIGDVVVFTPYYERPPEPAELDTATRTGQLTADAVVAPAKDSATSVAAARTPVAGGVGPAVHHQVAAVGRNITCVCGWTGSTAVEFEAHKSRPLQA